MNDRNRIKTKYLTVSAMLAALGVIFMTLGSFVEVLDLTTAALASLLCVYAMIEMGSGYSWGIFAATALLSCLLLPQKTPALFYTLFLGYYPILKAYFERLPKWASYLCKLLCFHVGIALLYLLFRWLFPEMTILPAEKYLIPVLYVLALVCFLVYDFAVTRLLTFYLFRLKKRFGLHKD